MTSSSTGSPSQEVRLLELAQVYLDDDLTDGEARELRGLVKDRALRARFISEVRWHIQLSDRLRTPGIPLSERVDALLDAEGRTPRVADAVAARIAARSSRRNQISARFLRRRRWTAAPWWIAAAAALLAVILVAQMSNAGPLQGVLVRGDHGMVERDGQTQRLSAQPRRLADGDVVTADGSDLVISFPDGSEIDLSSGGRLVLRSGAASAGKHLELQRGALVARVTRQHDGASLLVGTPQAHASVLGTTFLVRVESNGTRLVVEEGRIAFSRRSGGEVVEVPAGRSALAGVDGSLALIEPVKPTVMTQRRAWVPEPFTPTGGRPFSDDSPYNQVIPGKPVLDAQSPAMVARLAAQSAAVALFRHALPVYDVDAATPLRPITSIRRPERSVLPAEGLRIPAGASPNSGTNGSMVLLDWSAGRAWELYRFGWDGDGVRVDSGARASAPSGGPQRRHTARDRITAWLPGAGRRCSRNSTRCSRSSASPRGR